MQSTYSIKTTARIAGLLYFSQIPLGVFGIVYIPNNLFVPNNLSKTISNILANESLFRMSIVSAIICALVTTLTAYFIHKVLKPVDKTIARLIVVFTCVVTPITMLNELNNVAILLILKSNEIKMAFSTPQIHSAITFFIELHQYGLQITNIFFGLWLLPMGYLVIKSGYIPKIIGYLLLVTCFFYLFDFATFYLFPNFKITLSEYTWLGEVLMMFWLLIKGVKLEEFKKLQTIS